MQTSLEKERVNIAERQSALEKLQVDHTALLELRSELKVQVETLQFRLQQSNQGVSVEQTTTDTGNYSEENRTYIFA